MDESLKSIENAARFTAAKGIKRFTKFLDPAEAESARQIASSYGTKFSAFGGYPAAERVVGCFYPMDEVINETEYPFVCLGSKYSRKFHSVTHRDLLGAFMALGLTRACIGDIIIVESDIYLFAEEKTAEYIAVSMTAAGRVTLDFQILQEIPVMPEPEGSDFSCVLSSLRLDAVLAGAYRLSRNEAQELIRSGIVKVNHLVCEHVDTQLKENTLLSIRGKGRIRLKTINGTTRKQRIGVTFFRYV